MGSVKGKCLDQHLQYVVEIFHFYKLADYDQCWGKLLLKVMHYNIALLPKKVTNYVT